MRLFWMIVVCAAGWAMPALARPVTYPGGWSVMQMTDGSMHAAHLYYTLTPRYAVGYAAEYWRDGDWQFHGVQGAALLRRWNEKNSQANFWLEGGAGVAYSDAGAFDGKTEPAGFLSVAADWETRRWFLSHETRGYEAGKIDGFFMHKSRVGVAPYVGAYGDLHTWLMLQAEYWPEAGDKAVFTPMVRLFKNTYLAEAGISDQGDVLFNIMLQF